MRSLRMFALLAPLALAACGGGEERTVVVNPAPAAQPQPSPMVVQPGATVVVPPSATVTRVCPPGAVTC
ncbi:hypothetical protein STAQ_46900 [Allostella sp. ATCC 35155]|nr:hypothetical protein STAQ_46900 [Stella sp. ATCC 35155]